MLSSWGIERSDRQGSACVHPWLSDGLHLNILGAQQLSNQNQRAITIQLAMWVAT
jgi:hypothetical protein